MVVPTKIKKKNKKLPHESVNLLLSVYPKEIKSVYQRDICTPVFVVELRMITKILRLNLGINHQIN